jgi:SWI/SNF-related matrix-associated actin-dependent regulator of chromatin subfamily B protein 1
MNPPVTPQNQASAAAMMQQHQQQQNSVQQTPQQQQQMMQQGQATSPFGVNFTGGAGMQGSPPPMSMPGSPHRSAKRKIDSPHMGGNAPAMGPMNMNANMMNTMGPPSMMPNRLSMTGGGSGDLGAGVGMNGVPGGHHHHQQQQLGAGGMSQSPRPQGSNDMMNAGAMGMGPQTPVRQNSMMGGTPGMGAGQAQALAQQQLQQQQLQQQQQARQASLPPGVSSPMQGGPMRVSVPPAIPGPNVTGPIARTPSTVGGTPVAGGPVSGTGPSSHAGSVPPSGANALHGPNAGPSTAPASNNASNQAGNNAPSNAITVAQGQLPPLPANVQLNPATTQVTPVPLIDSLKLIPEISEKEITEIQGWMKKDKEYEVVMRKMKERMNSEMRGLFGGAAWWEKGAPSVDVNRWKRGREGFDVRYPLRRGKEKEGRERRKRQREGLRLCVSFLLLSVWVRMRALTCLSFS